MSYLRYTLSCLVPTAWQVKSVLLGLARRHSDRRLSNTPDAAEAGSLRARLAPVTSRQLIEASRLQRLAEGVAEGVAEAAGGVADGVGAGKAVSVEARAAPAAEAGTEAGLRRKGIAGVAEAREDHLSEASEETEGLQARRLPGSSHPVLSQIGLRPSPPSSYHSGRIGLPSLGGKDLTPSSEAAAELTSGEAVAAANTLGDKPAPSWVEREYTKYTQLWAEREKGLGEDSVSFEADLRASRDDLQAESRTSAR